MPVPGEGKNRPLRADRHLIARGWAVFTPIPWSVSPCSQGLLHEKVHAVQRPGGQEHPLADVHGVHRVRALQVGAQGQRDELREASRRMEQGDPPSKPKTGETVLSNGGCNRNMSSRTSPSTMDYLWNSYAHVLAVARAGWRPNRRRRPIGSTHHRGPLVCRSSRLRRSHKHCRPHHCANQVGPCSRGRKRLKRFCVRMVWRAQ